MGLEPSPLCDRDNTGIASSQKNFIGFLVKPLFKSWVSFLDCPAAELCTKTLEARKEGGRAWSRKQPPSHAVDAAAGLLAGVHFSVSFFSLAAGLMCVQRGAQSRSSPGA